MATMVLMLATCLFPALWREKGQGESFIHKRLFDASCYQNASNGTKNRKEESNKIKEACVWRAVVACMTQRHIWEVYFSTPKRLYHSICCSYGQNVGERRENNYLYQKKNYGPDLLAATVHLNSAHANVFLFSFSSFVLLAAMKDSTKLRVKQAEVRINKNKNN